MRINTNIQAINAYRQLTISHDKVSNNIEKLSSGLRINRAGDDAAGLAISEKMRSQIRGLQMAERNTLDGVSLIQTAEGALQEVHNALQRMRELSIQSANGTMALEDREAIQNEIDQLTFDIDRIAKTTQFNANPLLRGSLLSRPVITTNSPDIKYIGGGTWEGNIVADPSHRGEVKIKIENINELKDKDYVMINNKYYEFTNDEEVEAGHIGVTLGDSVVETLENLLNAIVANDKTFDASASSIDEVKGILTLKTAKNMSPADAAKIQLGKSLKEGEDEEIKSIKFLDKEGNIEVENLYASDISTNEKTVYLNFTELPKAGDKLIIGGEEGIIINFGDESVSYNKDEKEATLGVKDKTVYEVMEELFSVLSAAEGITALTDFKVNGNSLILTTNKTDDGGDNPLNIKFVDNDFETHAGKDMDINLQIGANYGESMELLIGVVDSAFLGIARKADHKELISTAGVDAEAGISVLSEEDASNAITFFDNAIRLVSESRSRLGAYQNRLEHTIANVTTTAENLTAAESRIRDVDMALEISEYTKNNIINQSAIAMLAQANQMPQGILQLLQ